MLYEEMVEDYLNKFILDHGQIKFHEVAKKLLTSKTVKSFLIITASSPVPTYNNIVSTVMNIPYFGFGKKTTIALGSVMLLQTWNEEINKSRNLLHDFELCVLLEQVVNKSMGLL